MNATPALRQWKSYHLLHQTVTAADCRETALLARSVHAVACGFVSHDAYVAAARAAAAQHPSPLQLDYRLQQAMTLDANPVAALLRSAKSTNQLQQRWNSFNRLATLGVRTRMLAGPAQAPRLLREPQTCNPGAALRADLITRCVDLLVGTITATADSDPVDQLSHLARFLGLRGAVVEVTDLLYAEPGADLGHCANSLACSARTLQRTLARQHMNFGTLRQAVRLTIAGHRLRHADEPITQTAQISGFFDSAHFNHAWHQSCDITPSCYRALAQA